MASRDGNKKKKNLEVFVRDRYNSFRVLPIDDSGSNEDGKRKEVIECSSRYSVFETGESWKIPSSYPLETNSNPFYIPGQPETSSRNGVSKGASSLVQIWEARSQQSSSSLSQSLLDSRTSSESSLSDFLNDEARKSNESSGEEIDWFPQSDMNNVSNSYENDGEGRCFLELASCSTPRIRGRQASEDVCKMILRDRENELELLGGRYAVSKFSPRGCGRLQYMLMIRSLERCIVIQERYRSKSDVNRFSRGSRNRYMANTKKGFRSNLNSAVETKNLSGVVYFRVKSVLQETMEKSNTRENQAAADKPEIANKPVFNDAASNENGSKKPEIERKATEEGEGLRKAIVKEGEETDKSSSSIVEKVNLLESKKRANRRRTMGKAKDEGKDARRVIDVKTVGRNEERRKKEEGKSMEIEEYRSNPQDVTSVVCLDREKEEVTARQVLRERGKEEKSSQKDEETSKAEKQQAAETLFLILESPIFVDAWDENETEYEENEDCNREIMYYDWISDISRPRSYWEDLKKQRVLEVMNNISEKGDMWNLIKWRTVSSFLEGDFREKIDKIMISCVQKRSEIGSNLVEEEEGNEETLVECSERYQGNVEENETKKLILEPETETQMICDLKQQIKQLQRDILELQSLVKSCVDFQKSLEFESLSDSLERNCSICFEMPIDSLLYRCGHMCTCLKCAHELQWSNMKCPICMAPIVDVVRAFLDS
ncbi:unnamed protein product [Arabidopsis thaliana]|uniref:RING-type domain-containing protein n=1 Tax=Arabidopsis thaliana TaxID=3702 RepID=A0A654G7X8_ARATH|nr:unnamed protein product [Arabidopsis thaliana]